MKRFALLTVAAAALAGCSDRPLPTELLPGGNPVFAAQTVTSADKFTIELTGTTCDGVPVTATADVNAVFTTTLDANGGVHVGLLFSAEGTGTDVLGTEYIASATSNNTVYEGPKPSVFTIEEKFQFVSKTSLDNFLAHAVLHATVDANGNVKSVVDQAFIKCDMPA